MGYASILKSSLDPSPVTVYPALTKHQPGQGRFTEYKSKQSGREAAAPAHQPDNAAELGVKYAAKHQRLVVAAYAAPDAAAVCGKQTNILRI